MAHFQSKKLILFMAGIFACVLLAWWKNPGKLTFICFVISKKKTCLVVLRTVGLIWTIFQCIGSLPVRLQNLWSCIFLLEFPPHISSSATLFFYTTCFYYFYYFFLMALWKLVGFVLHTSLLSWEIWILWLPECSCGWDHSEVIFPD